MPPWFLQTMNLACRILKSFEGATKPYNVSMVNHKTAYIFLSMFLFRMIDDWNDLKSKTLGKKVPILSDKIEDLKQPREWYVKWAVKYKFLGKNEIEIKHRKETLRKNNNTFRRLGVNIRLHERNVGANRVLATATKLFKTLAPTLGEWTHELSDILQQRERVRQNR